MPVIIVAIGAALGLWLYTRLGTALLLVAVLGGLWLVARILWIPLSVIGTLLWAIGKVVGELGRRET
jgi:hypothetical protein